MSYNRCKDIHKFGNKYLPSVYKTQVKFRSHFSEKKSASYGLRKTVYGGTRISFDLLNGNKNTDKRNRYYHIAGLHISRKNRME